MTEYPIFVGTYYTLCREENQAVVAAKDAVAAISLLETMITEEHGKIFGGEFIKISKEIFRKTFRQTNFTSTMPGVIYADSRDKSLTSVGLHR
jgi:hypothetical protein